MSPDAIRAVLIALLCWGIAAAVVALVLTRMLRPASPEPDEHEACHGDPEWRRAIGEPGMIDHFHNGSNPTTLERNHVG